MYDHLVRAVDLVESQRDLLTGSLEIDLSAVANRTNEVMKVLTIYGTLAIPLVVITGFFGMNLHLPWNNNPNGVWYASGMMLVSMAGVLWYFKEVVVLRPNLLKCLITTPHLDRARRPGRRKQAISPFDCFGYEAP